jgi:hypothetical protein
MRAAVFMHAVRGRSFETLSLFVPKTFPIALSCTISIAPYQTISIAPFPTPTPIPDYPARLWNSRFAPIQLGVFNTFDGFFCFALSTVFEMAPLACGLFMHP